MSALILLNLLNELGKRDKLRGLPSVLSLFRNEFNKFNTTGARMLESIYHMTFKIAYLAPNVINILLFTQLFNESHYATSPLMVHDVISLPGATSCEKSSFICILFARVLMR